VSVFAGVLMDELRANSKTYKTSIALRIPSNFRIVYRSSELMHKYALSIVGIMILPSHELISKFVLFANFMLLTDWKNMSKVDRARLFFMSIALQTIWIALLEVGGRFHSNSCKTVASIKYHKCWMRKNRKYFKKFKKSCKPLFFSTLGFFKIKRRSVLRFLKSIVKGTFNVVITLSN